MIHLLLSTVIASPSYELILINQLNSAFDFDHNIFLLHSSLDISQFVSTIQAIQIPRCLFLVDGNLNVSEIFQSIRLGKVELLIVGIGRADFEGILDVMLLVKSVHLLNVNFKIALFLSHIMSDDELEVLFKWCWNHGIVNIFVAFHQPTSKSLLNIFGFNPFGTFDVINRTASVVVGNSTVVQQIFPEKITNLRQHSFRIAVFGDNSLLQYSSNVAFLGGPDEKLWTTVVSTVNATYSIFLVSSSREPKYLLDNGTVDIHGDLTDLLEPQVITMYPMVMEILSIVVPKAKPYSTFEAYMKMATGSNLVGYTTLMIGAAVLVLISVRYVNNKNCTIIECVADIMNLLLNNNTAIRYQRMSFSENCLAIPMTFAGFVIVNGFLSSLKSQLTRPIMQPQIETIEELYRSPLSITSPNEYWLAKDSELLNSLLKHGNISYKMSIIDYPDFVRQISDEVQFSFGEHNSVAKFMCKHKSYHISSIEMQRIWYAHNTRPDFPFIDRFNEIIQRVNTAGLYEKWWRDAIIEDKLFRTITPDAHADHFSTPVFIVYGWIAGCIVFVIEVNWKIIKNKLKKRRGNTVE